MKPATGAFSRGSEAVPRHERPARCVRLGARFLARTFQLRTRTRWQLLASPWVTGEVTRNLVKFPIVATAEWLHLRQQLEIVDDVVSLDRALVFPVSKDRPVLLSALASANVLLTLDREDFLGVLGGQCYGLPILLPCDFLGRERSVGRLPAIR
jgi:hypothetical protein